MNSNSTPLNTAGRRRRDNVVTNSGTTPSRLGVRIPARQEVNAKLYKSFATCRSRRITCHHFGGTIGGPLRPTRTFLLQLDCHATPHEHVSSLPANSPTDPASSRRSSSCGVAESLERRQTYVSYQDDHSSHSTPCLPKPSNSRPEIRKTRPLTCRASHRQIETSTRSRSTRV